MMWIQVTMTHNDNIYLIFVWNACDNTVYKLSQLVVIEVVARVVPNHYSS